MTLQKLALSLILAAGAAATGAYFVGQRAAMREAAAEAAYPPTGQFVELDGQTLHYEMSGSGPDLVLIHGALGNLRDMTFSLRDSLADRYRVTVFDRPGFGYSGALPNGDASLIGQARVLQRAAARIGIRDPIVLGHSYGGAVAMSWALHPDEAPAAALVLVSAPTLPWPDDIDILYRATGNQAASAVVVPLLTAFVTDAYQRKSLNGIFAPALPPTGYADVIASGLTLRRSSLRANGKQVYTLRDQIVAMEPRYPQLTLPIELVHGDADLSVPLAIHSGPLAERLPIARLTVVPGAGHMPHHSHQDMVIDAIDRALQRVDLP